LVEWSESTFEAAVSGLQRATQQCLLLARERYPEYPISDITVRCDLRGAMAGQYLFDSHTIRYNLYIAVSQWEAFLQRTVVHEVAHHVVAQIWKQGVAPHGRQWRTVMQALGATDVTRCHSYKLDGVPRKRQKRYNYRCACRSHSISATRHNRMQRGMTYLCGYCRENLTPVMQTQA